MCALGSRELQESARITEKGGGLTDAQFKMRFHVLDYTFWNVTCFETGELALGIISHPACGWPAGSDAHSSAF